jgi:hemerythrin
MNLIEWKDSYSVGVKSIDDQHQKLFRIINELFMAIKESRQSEAMGGTEEKYFEEFGYEKKAEHKAMHQVYVGKIKSFQDEFDKNNAFISHEMLDFLEDWIIYHVTSEDKKYSQCFRDHGLI